MSKWNYDRPILPHENEITKQREAECMKELKKIIGTHCEPTYEEGLQDCAKQINDLKKRLNAWMLEAVSIAEYAAGEPLDSNIDPMDAIRRDIERLKLDAIESLANEKAMQRRICTMEAKRHNTYLYPLWVTGEEIAKENGWDCFEKEGE